MTDLIDEFVAFTKTLTGIHYIVYGVLIVLAFAYGFYATIGLVATTAWYFIPLKWTCVAGVILGGASCAYGLAKTLGIK